MKLQEKIKDKRNRPYVIAVMESVVLLLLFLLPVVYTKNDSVKDYVMGYRALKFFQDEAVKEVKYGGISLLFALIFAGLLLPLSIYGFFAAEENRKRIQITLILDEILFLGFMIAEMVFFSLTKEYHLYLGFGSYMIAIIGLVCLVLLGVSFKKTKNQSN